jgi:hypothetical protein
LLIGARGAAALMLSEQKFFGPFFQKRTACFLPPGEARIWVNHKGGWYHYCLASHQIEFRNGFWSQMQSRSPGSISGVTVACSETGHGKPRIKATIAFVDGAQVPVYVNDRNRAWIVSEIQAHASWPQTPPEHACENAKTTPRRYAKEHQPDR